MIKNKDLILRKQPTLKDFQQYVSDLEKARGFTKSTILEQCLRLGEEVGELFKAIRKNENLKVDKNSKFGSIPEELVDCFIFLLAISDKYGIDLEQAFRDKEEINKKREWKVIKTKKKQ